MLIRTAVAIAIAISVLSLNLSRSAYAQTPEQQQACQFDAQTYCQEAIPDHNRVAACLRRNIRMISPACRQVLSSPSSRRRHRL